MGVDVRADRRRRPARPRRGRSGGAGAPAAPQPLAGQHRGRAGALPQGAHPGDEPRPARPAAARALPRRRDLVHAGAWHAVQVGGARRRNPRCGGSMSERSERDMWVAGGAVEVGEGRGGGGGGGGGGRRGGGGAGGGGGGGGGGEGRAGRARDMWVAGG